MALEENRARVGSGGRIVIPARFRHAMGIGVGDELLLALADGDLRLRTPAQAIRHAQDIVRRYVPADTRLSDELIRDRRKEAAGE